MNERLTNILLLLAIAVSAVFLGKVLLEEVRIPAYLTSPPPPPMPEPEVCDDGVDNDLDGLIDMEDSDCWPPEPPPAPMPESETCDDGIDNDLDGFIDMEDGDCWLIP